MNLTLETPLKRRDYERNWDFSSSINRLNISLEADSNVMQNFAQHLTWIAQEKGGIALEIDELYSNENSLQKILNPVSADIKTIDERHYSITSPVKKETLEVLLSIEAREFYITFWGNKEPRIITQECTLNRVEELYLIQLGEFEPVVSLSPNHKHMEIMSLDEAFTIRLSQFVDRCEKG